MMIMYSLSKLWEICSTRTTLGATRCSPSWSWSPQSPPSGCPPLRCSQADGRWLGQCSHSSKREMWTRNQGAIPHISVPICFHTFHCTKRKVSSSSASSQGHTHNAISLETYLAQNPPNLLLLMQQSLGCYT